MKYLLWTLLAVILVVGLFYYFDKSKKSRLSPAQQQLENQVNEATVYIKDPHTGFEGDVDFTGKTASVYYKDKVTKYIIKDVLQPYNLDNAGELEYPYLVEADYPDSAKLDYLVISQKQSNTRFNIVDKILIGNTNQIEDIHNVANNEVAVDAKWGEGDNEESVILTYKFLDNKIVPGKDNIDISKPKPTKQPITYNQQQTTNDKQQTSDKKIDNPGGNGTVVLSFDDGPGTYTPNVLDVLKDYGIKATFFMIGQNAESHTDYVRRINDEEHEINNHTYDHQDLSKMSYDAQMDEISKTNSIIKNILSDINIKWLRPPYGSYNDDTDKVLNALGMRRILWNVDPRDWAGAPAGDIANAVLSNVDDGSIVLMHDGVANSVETAKALPQIIEGIQAKGLKMVKLSEMKGN